MELRSTPTSGAAPPAPGLRRHRSPAPHGLGALQGGRCQRAGRGAVGLIGWLLALAACAGSALWWSLARERAAHGLNVVLISIDTCRADRLGCYGFARPTTPGLDALAQRGVLFENACTTDPITLPAHTSLLTGTLPLHHGVHDNNYHVDGSLVTLAEQLGGAGWSTAAFVSTYVLDSRFGLDQGFELYDDELDADLESVADRWALSERRGELTNRAALDWLAEQRDGPFFLFLHYFDPHARYDPPEPFDSLFADDLYAGEIAYVDRCIEAVLERLDALGLADETLVVVTADHGESLGQHGERTHAYFAYQSTIRVPLILIAPGGRRGVRVAEPVSLIDVAPSVLALTGVERAAAQTGQDLSPVLLGPGAPQERDIYCESLYPTKFGCAALRALVCGRWKYISSVEPELYDLVDDPGETRNRIADQPQVAAELAARLSRLLEERQDGALASAAARTMDDSLGRLKALGYAAGAVSDSLEPPAGAQDAKRFLPIYNRLMDVHPLRVAGRPEEAAAACREVLAARPGLLDALEVLGDIALKEGRHADALEHLREYVRSAQAQRPHDAPAGRHPLDPGLSRAWLAMGDAQRELRQLPEALESCQHAARSAPDSPDPLVALGDLLAQELGRLDEAIRAYEAAIEVDPGLVVAHTNLGNCWFAKKRLDEAEQSYLRALEVDPEDFQASYNLGSVRLDAGRPQEALPPLEKASQRDPAAILPHVLLGRVLVQLERWDEAQIRFRQALGLDAQHDEAAFGLGRSLLASGRGDDARSTWRAHALLGEGHLRALDERVWSLAAASVAQDSDPAEALHLAQLLAELSAGRDAWVLDTLALAQAASGDFPAAAASARRALALLAADTPLAAGLRQRLELYLGSQPPRGASARAGRR